MTIATPRFPADDEKTVEQDTSALIKGLRFCRVMLDGRAAVVLAEHRGAVVSIRATAPACGRARDRRFTADSLGLLVS